MKKKSKYSKLAQVKIDAGLIGDLKTIAEAKSQPMSDWVSEVLREAVRRELPPILRRRLKELE